MSIQYLQHRNNKLAYQYSAGHNAAVPTVVFLPGFRSDMEGNKATYLEERCQMRGQAFLRFDYSGHGISEGAAFEEGTIGAWLDDALAIIDKVTKGPLILVGSSMGGWIALRGALERPERIAAIVGLAAAPDFTREIEAQLSPAQKEIIEKEGIVFVPNEYSDEPYIFTRALLEDGEKQCLLDKTNAITVPVRLIQGMKDTDVPWQKAAAIAQSLSGDDVQITLIKDGDHRLSRPQDLMLINKTIEELNGVYT